MYSAQTVCVLCAVPCAMWLSLCEHKETEGNLVECSPFIGTMPVMCIVDISFHSDHIFYRLCSIHINRNNLILSVVFQCRLQSIVCTPYIRPFLPLSADGFSMSCTASCGSCQLLSFDDTHRERYMILQFTCKTTSGRFLDVRTQNARLRCECIQCGSSKANKC